MSKLPALTGDGVIKALTKIEFKIVRQKGSHVRMKHEDGRVVTILFMLTKTLGKVYCKRYYVTYPRLEARGLSAALTDQRDQKRY